MNKEVDVAVKKPVDVAVKKQVDLAVKKQVDLAVEKEAIKKEVDIMVDAAECASTAVSNMVACGKWAIQSIPQLN